MRRLLAALLLAIPASPALAVNDGPLTCTEAQRAARRAPEDVPRQYLDQALADICAGRYVVHVLNVSQGVLDTLCSTNRGIQAGFQCGALTSPVGFGGQPSAYIFMGPNVGWPELAHELSHVPPNGWRHRQ